jgi:hypothetical protein
MWVASAGFQIGDLLGTLGSNSIGGFRILIFIKNDFFSVYIYVSMFRNRIIIIIINK